MNRMAKSVIDAMIIVIKPNIIMMLNDEYKLRDETRLKEFATRITATHRLHTRDLIVPNLCEARFMKRGCVPRHGVVWPIVAAASIADASLDIDNAKILMKLRIQNSSVPYERVKLQEMHLPLRRRLVGVILFELCNQLISIFNGAFEQVIGSPRPQLRCQRLLN